MNEDADFRRFLHRFYEKEASKASQELTYMDSQHKKLLSIHLNNLTYIINKNSLCLDVGCAEGLYTRFMAIISNFVVGVDLSSEKIKKGKHKSKTSSINFIQADWNYLPFKDLTFDIALFSEGPEHSVEPLVTLKEIRRVLKAGGLLEASAPVEPFYRIIPTPFWNIGKQISRKMLNAARKAVFIGHLNEFTKESLKGIMQKSGFQIVKSTFDPFIDQLVDYPFRVEIEEHMKRRVFPYGVILAKKPNHLSQHLKG